MRLIGQAESAPDAYPGAERHWHAQVEMAARIGRRQSLVLKYEAEERHFGVAERGAGVSGSGRPYEPVAQMGEALF
jgi:hypothetical protein